MLKYKEIELPSNKKFGLFISTVLFVVGCYFFYLEDLFVFMILSVCFAVCLLITAFKSEILLPANRLWMGIGFTLGLVVSPIILGIIFFLLLTPVGIITRLFGRDELNLKMKKKDTFWKFRNDNSMLRQNFNKQF